MSPSSDAAAITSSQQAKVSIWLVDVCHRFANLECDHIS